MRIDLVPVQMQRMPLEAHPYLSPRKWTVRVRTARPHVRAELVTCIGSEKCYGANYIMSGLQSTTWFTRSVTPMIDIPGVINNNDLLFAIVVLVPKSWGGVHEALLLQGGEVLLAVPGAIAVADGKRLLQGDEEHMPIAVVLDMDATRLLTRLTTEPVIVCTALRLAKLAGCKLQLELRIDDGTTLCGTALAMAISLDPQTMKLPPLPVSNSKPL